MSDEKEVPIEEQYKQLTQYEHILTRPDTYVGSLEFQKATLWVFNSETESLEQRDVNFVPGLFKIFDEIIVNAADNYQSKFFSFFILSFTSFRRPIYEIHQGLH